MRKRLYLLLFVLIMTVVLISCSQENAQNVDNPEPVEEQETTATDTTDTTEETEDEIIKDTADVIVIGSGGAGMSAAATAIENGASVIIIEKMPFIGGNTIVAGSGFNSANPERQGALVMTKAQREMIESYLVLEPKNELMEEWQNTVGGDLAEYDAKTSKYLYDSPALHKIQTYIGGDYLAKPELIDALCENAFDSFNWLTDLGATWKEGIAAGLGAMWPRSHTATDALGTSGSAFVIPQKTYIENNGGKILTRYKATEILMENGRVVGVKGETEDGNIFEVKANKSVVLATGGFAANVELRQKYNTKWPDLGPDVPTTNPISSTGDGIIMAEKIGANLLGMEWIQLLAIGDPDITPIIENTLWFNKNGERFVREDGRRDEICSAVLEQPGQYFYSIYDSHTIVDILDGKNTHGLDIEGMVDGDNLIKTETLEELALELDIPAEKLIKTVNDFNEYVENGSGDPFGRATYNSKIEKGPFYTNKARARVHYTMGGVEINSEACVLDKNGNVIPGLYAAGEVTGGIHGSNRLGGNAIADIITFGRIAGEHASK